MTTLMNGIVLERVKEAPQVTPQVLRLIAACDGELLREELQERLGLADRKHFRTNYLRPALDEGLIEMTKPGSPRSSKQKYRLTAKGEALSAESQKVDKDNDDKR